MLGKLPSSSDTKVAKKKPKKKVQKADSKATNQEEKAEVSKKFSKKPTQSNFEAKKSKFTLGTDESMAPDSAESDEDERVSSEDEKKPGTKGKKMQNKVYSRNKDGSDSDDS